MATGDAVRMEDYGDNHAPRVAVVPVDFDGPLPRPTRDLDQVKADLNRAGYAILTDVLTPGDTREARQVLVDEIAREEALDENRVRRFYTDPDDKNRRLSRLPNRHRWFRDFLEHPVAIELTKYILGPTLLNESYLVHSYGANLTRPGSGEQFIHLDRGMDFHDQTKPLQSRFIWCLDEFAEENGATRVVPGSHLWNDRIDMTGATYYESVPAEAPPGSLIIYSDMLLHGTGANVSTDRERAGVIVGYCPPWCRPMINFPLVLDPAVMVGTSRTLRQLLGYSSVSIGFDEQWESAPAELRALCVPATMEY
jgi:ectoine hydroxylase-related dioxygenase (phytanoyl-CoA dioxygenase family)